VGPREHPRRCIAHLGTGGGVEAAAEGCNGFNLGGDPVAGVEREFDMGFVEVETEKEEDDKAGEEQPCTPPHQA
jgi:hypothetical protein